LGDTDLPSFRKSEYHFDRRVQATINSAPVDSIYDQFGRAVTQATASVWQRSELYAGWHVATYTNNTTYFDHRDWLGTVRARSSVTGASVETCTSLPFGDAQTCTGTDWSPLHFTGQDWDSESSLTHFMFRQLSTTQGALDHAGPRRIRCGQSRQSADLEPVRLCWQQSTECG